MVRKREDHPCSQHRWAPALTVPTNFYRRAASGTCMASASQHCDVDLKRRAQSYGRRWWTVRRGSRRYGATRSAINLAILVGRMGFPGPVDDQLAAQLRGLDPFAMSASEAAEAARNLVGFVRLLAEIDCNKTEGGEEHAGNRSGGAHRVRQRRAR